MVLSENDAFNGRADQRLFVASPSFSKLRFSHLQGSLRCRDVLFAGSVVDQRVMLLGLLELRLSYLELTGIPVVVLTRDDTGCKKLVVALHLRARVLEDRLIFLDGRECLAPFLRPRAVDGLAPFRFALRLQVCVL